MATETEVLNRLAEEAAVPPPSEPVEPKTPEAIPAAVPPAEELPTEQPAEGVEEPEPNLEETPESSGDFAKYKALYKDNPDLRNIIGREQAFSQLGDYQSVKEVISRIPTVEDAEKLATDSENYRTMGQVFRESPTDFIESLKDSDSGAYQNFVRSLPEVLAQHDSDAYREQAQKYVQRTIYNLWAATQGDTEFQKALDVVAGSLGLRLGNHLAPTNQPDNSEAAKLRKQLEDRQNADDEREFSGFWQETDNAIINNCVSEIDVLLKSKLPNATEAQRVRMGQEIWTKTLETLGSQPQTMQQINAYRESAMGGRRGIADHKAIVDFSTKRAKLIIPKAAQSVIGEWSKEILRTNQAGIQNRKEIAARTKDAGAGPQGTSSAAASPSSNGKRRTAEDVFRELENRTYVAPASR